MHIYAFGSICRGEYNIGSDIDLLAIVESYNLQLDPSIFSIYSYNRIIEIWQEGNPFAWHLAIESQIIYSSDDINFIKSLEKPNEYRKCAEDCRKFFNLLSSAISSVRLEENSKTFELSTIFLAVRNFATCFLLGTKKIGNFSRDSALHLGEKSIKISNSTYEILKRARYLSTRGTGKMLEDKEIESALTEIHLIEEWMKNLLCEVEKNVRI